MRDILLFTVDSMGQNILDITGWPRVFDQARQHGISYLNAYAGTPSTHMSCHYMLGGQMAHPWDMPKEYFLGFSQQAERTGSKLVQQKLPGFRTVALVPWAAHGHDMVYGFSRWLGSNYTKPDGDQELVPLLREAALGPRPVFLWIHIFSLYGYAHGRFGRTLTTDMIKDGAWPLVQYADAVFSSALTVFPSARVILSADHGDAFNDGATGHGFEISPGCSHVPLVVWDRQNGQAQTVEPAVSIRIIADWIRHFAELAPIPSPSGHALVRTYLPLQGGGELAGATSSGMIRLMLDGDRGSFARDPGFFAPGRIREQILGEAYYPAFSPHLVDLRERIILEEEDARARSIWITQQ